MLNIFIIKIKKNIVTELIITVFYNMVWLSSKLQDTLYYFVMFIFNKQQTNWRSKMYSQCKTFSASWTFIPFTVWSPGAGRTTWTEMGEFLKVTLWAANRRTCVAKWPVVEALFHNTAVMFCTPSPQLCPQASFKGQGVGIIWEKKIKGEKLTPSTLSLPTHGLHA